MEENLSSQLKTVHFPWRSSNQNKKQTASTVLNSLPWYQSSFFPPFLYSFLDFLYGEVISKKAKSQNVSYYISMNS